MTDFKPDFHNGAEVARRAEAHSQTLSDAQRARNIAPARRPQVAREFTRAEAERFREAGNQIVALDWN